MAIVNSEPMKVLMMEFSPVSEGVGKLISVFYQLANYLMMGNLMVHTKMKIEFFLSCLGDS
jgi:hypothetical protein